ncbi:MAG: Alanine racemase [Firmicutes bacterium ADurb.Bin356]|nr:MAG: Alanine racemase [Firmicutes bacterium ADurb.Bin356]
MLRPTYTTIDFSALKHNYELLRANIGRYVKLMPVVKANAYGHGIIEIGIETERLGADYLGVSIPEEGKRLRDAGVHIPILVLGGMLPEGAEMAVSYDLAATVFSVEMLDALSHAALLQKKSCTVHIKVDTGMNRLGVKSLSSFRELLEHAAGCPNLKVEGLFTHFAVSELSDKEFTLKQAERFSEYINIAREMGYCLLLHASNSGALLDLPKELSYDMVRAGIAIYGCHPGPECGKHLQLKPVLTWKSVVVHIKEVEPGETISYGRKYTAQKRRTIATLPVGYGDGYKRCMSNRAEVLIHGKRAPIVGMICMDQCMADITEIDGVKIGDEVVLLGSQEGAGISADEMAAWADTISYEILLSISDRVPRVYINTQI